MMQLKVMTPTGVVLECTAAKVVAEAQNGSFCLLPRHVDFVAALVAGLLAFVDDAGEERFLALDHGVLVKVGRDVLVAAMGAIKDQSVGDLRRAVEDRFELESESEKRAHTALAKIEAGMVQRMLELK